MAEGGYFTIQHIYPRKKVVVVKRTDISTNANYVAYNSHHSHHFHKDYLCAFEPYLSDRPTNNLRKAMLATRQSQSQEQKK